LTEEQKRKMTKAIFTNEDILDQLREASKHRDYVEDDQEALNIINEARNEKKL
jgi:ABC-type phosphate/phosphonate transport system substrate-binding protein